MNLARSFVGSWASTGALASHLSDYSLIGLAFPMDLATRLSLIKRWKQSSANADWEHF